MNHILAFEEYCRDEQDTQETALDECHLPEGFDTMEPKFIVAHPSHDTLPRRGRRVVRKRLAD